MRTMFDACDPANIPTLPQMVAGYLDGPCKDNWQGPAWSRWPRAQKVRITDEANPLADVFDYERGTAPLAQVRTAVADRAKAYLPSVVYVNESNWSTAKQDLRGLPVAWWVADPTGKEHLVPGSVATQWGWFGTYDISLVADAWPKGA